MKQLLHIFIGVILFTLSACQRETTYPLAMQQAESLMNTRPDSALHLLQGMADSIFTLPEEAQMYYHLLTIQAKDKQYITHTSDSLINRIVSFYEEYNDNDRLMMAYFYQGSTYRDMNDAPRALKAFHQAIDAGKETENLTLLGQTYGQMGTLFSYQKLYDEALEAKQKALQFYIQQKDSTRYPYLNRDIARIYNAKNNNDSALHYYKKALELAVNMNLKRQSNSIASELGCLYYNIGKNDIAKSILHNVVLINSNMTNALLYLGKIYHQNRQLDSARYCLEKVLVGKNIRDQRSAYQHLSQLSEMEGSRDKASFYWRKYQILQDSIEYITKTEEMGKYHLLYRFQRSEKEINKLQIEKQKIQTQLYGFIIIVILVLSACVILIVCYVKEKNIVKQQKLRHALLENQLEIQNHTQISKKEISIKKFRETPIFKKLNDGKTFQSPYTNQDWKELQSEIELYFPSFIERLYMLYPNIKEHEFHVCLLLKAGVRIKDIAIITESTSTSITHLRSRLYTKMTGKNGTAKNLDNLLSDL